jgi:hypothetical protein
MRYSHQPVPLMAVIYSRTSAIFFISLQSGREEVWFHCPRVGRALFQAAHWG